MKNLQHNLEYSFKLNAFELFHGGTISNLKVKYSIYGKLSLPVIVVLGGISANHQLIGQNGWWNDIVGLDKPVDINKFCVISIEYFSSQSKLNSKHKLVSSYDQANLVKRLLEHLNIESIQTFIGSSYGGMVALAFGDLFSRYTNQIICICAAHKNSIKSIALREVQRSIVKLTSLSKEGVALARSLAMIGYRGEEEFEERFSNEPNINNGQTNFEVSHYLNHNGKKFADNFDTNRYLNLSKSIDIHRINPSNINANTLLIAIKSDQLVPIKLVKELKNSITGSCQLNCIQSKFGHDGFLLEHKKIGSIINKFIKKRTNMSHNFETTIVRAGIDTDLQHGSVTPPLYLSSNYSFEDLNKPRKYDYSRSGNPTRDILSDALAKLENAAGGVITSTGMSAVTLVLQLLNKGDVVIAPHDCYGGTFRLLTTLHEKGIIEVKFLDQSNQTVIENALKQKPALLWIETPSNPLLRVVDIEKLCTLAGPDVLKVVDNTFLSPALQKPINFGADLVVHSTTKYINGHSDVVGGAVLAKTEELAEKVKWWANCIGITASPFDCLLTTRGLRTLNVRMNQHLLNIKQIIVCLKDHHAIEKIYYPGLEDHEGHKIAKKQQSDFGAMLSFKLKGDFNSIHTFVNSLKYFTLAESLGGVESLVCHPATMTHAAMAEDARINAGITENLIRLSVGIESADDLISDLDYALNKSQIRKIENQVNE